MGTVANSTIISSTLTEVRDVLRSNITDPRSSRTISNWIFTAWPGKEVEYPVIVLRHVGTRDEWMAIGTVNKIVKINVQFDVFARSAKERDTLWDEIYNDLVTNYKTTSVVDLNLHGLDLVSCFDSDDLVPKEMGNIHRKTGEFQFTYYRVS